MAKPQTPETCQLCAFPVEPSTRTKAKDGTYHRRCLKSLDLLEEK